MEDVKKMVFGKKKETAAEKKARLEKELAATVAEVEKELPPLPEAPTPVQEMSNEPKGNGNSVKSLIEELEAKFGQVFPELGPSGHAAVERMLLIALIAEVRALREESNIQ
ncbi:MAG: hypothetical protein DRR04_05400 [Gammaproteobacteria bacterium]|nr:MAG: hypothetical protein DRQ97_06805 [Gammaproteobacteria bacterium]RLA60564.1 MAG: hypothetical protein DRR04_05400 [Gammaproteobacteria bacterium]